LKAIAVSTEPFSTRAGTDLTDRSSVWISAISARMSFFRRRKNTLADLGVVLLFSAAWLEAFSAGDRFDGGNYLAQASVMVGDAGHIVSAGLELQEDDLMVSFLWIEPVVSCGVCDM